MTMAQGGTWTNNLANSLPCSNQLTYQVIWQLSGWVWVLKAEFPDQSDYQAGMIDGEGAVSVKHETQAQL